MNCGSPAPVPNRAHVIDLLANDLLGQPEFGNAVNEHSADFVQGFEDVDPVSFLDEVAGDREAGGAAPNDGHFLAGGRSFLNFVEVEVLLLVVGDEALEIADAEGLNLFSHQAAALAMIFLRADASSDSGRARCLRESWQRRRGSLRQRSTARSHEPSRPQDICRCKPAWRIRDNAALP
jgi:hypothetical protein